MTELRSDRPLGLPTHSSPLQSSSPLRRRTRPLGRVPRGDRRAGRLRKTALGTILVDSRGRTL